MKSLKKIIWKILNVMGLGGIVQLYLLSGLREDGWFLSFKKKQAINRKGEPIPWYTYSFIKFLDTRLRKDFEIFEFGCGNSTIWLSSRVKSITCVEDDKKWIDLIKAKLPTNTEILYFPVLEGENGDYAKAAQKNNKKYQIIIVDGKDRNNCVKNAVESLSEEGLLILDNSDRAAYQPAKDFLKEKGFKCIDFGGMVPIESQNYCTTIYYRQNNCFGI